MTHWAESLGGNTGNFEGWWRLGSISDNFEGGNAMGPIQCHLKLAKRIPELCIVLKIFKNIMIMMLVFRLSRDPNDLHFLYLFSLICVQKRRLPPISKATGQQNLRFGMVCTCFDNMRH